LVIKVVVGLREFWIKQYGRGGVKNFTCLQRNSSPASLEREDDVVRGRHNRYQYVSLHLGLKCYNAS